MTCMTYYSGVQEMTNPQLDSNSIDLIRGLVAREVSRLELAVFSAKFDQEHRQARIRERGQRSQPVYEAQLARAQIAARSLGIEGLNS
jgi:hypothetical protein